MSDKYPEHEKQSLVLGEARAAGDFLEWLKERYFLCELAGDDKRFVPVYSPIRELLADWLGIDLAKIDEEKQAMLAELRAAHEQRQEDGTEMSGRRPREEKPEEQSGFTDEEAAEIRRRAQEAEQKPEGDG